MLPRLHRISSNPKKNFTPDKVYAVWTKGAVKHNTGM
jgi:hypothetical protein